MERYYCDLPGCEGHTGWNGINARIGKRVEISALEAARRTMLEVGWTGLDDTERALLTADGDSH